VIRLFEGPTKLLLRGDERDIQKICDQLRFYPKGFEHSPKYQAYVLTDGREGWNGTICPIKFNRDRSATCLRGHKDVILRLARKEDIETDISHCIPSPFANLVPDDLPDDLIQADFELDQYQRESVVYWLKHGMGVNKIAVNGGKCLAKGTPVMLADGSWQRVECLAVGDLLMGPDSCPRTVTGLGHGVDSLFRVHQGNGDDFVCNGDHILVLESSGFRNSDGKRYSTGEQVEISVLNYLKLPKWAKNQLKGFKTGVEFRAQAIPLNPYFLGLWLGDGSSAGAAITTGDPEIKTFLSNFAAGYGLKIRAEAGNGCETLHLTTGERKPYNPITYQLRRIGVLNNKHIPKIYAKNSACIRKQILAGLIDSDGHVLANKIEFTFCNSTLAHDVLWLCRSLGLRTTLYPKKCRCQTGAVSDGFRIIAKGDFSGVYPIIERKRKLPAPRRGLRYAISITPEGRGEYFGFTLDGDGRFLLKDFTVSHNTAMFAAAAAMITRRIGDDCRFLYVTPSERLTRQAYNDMRGFLPGWKITQYGGSRKDNTGDMVICTVAMLWTNRQELIRKKWFDEFIAVLYDESHHVASETSTNLMLLLPCFFRLGASDTKHAEDAGKKASIQGLLGPIRFTVPVGVYIDLGRSAKPHIYLIENKKWRNKYHELPHLAEPGTKAWALIGDEWREGTYAGPVYETDPKTGDYKLVEKNELVGTKDAEVMDAYGRTRTEQTADWHKVLRPVIVDGVHTLQFPNDKEFYEVSSDYCLLERVSDIALVRFRERNEMIVKWATHFAIERKFPTLVVCTRSMHVLILEALLKRAIGAQRVQTLVGEDSSKKRDQTFEWFRHTPGSVLISPLVQEGVSINEIRGGVIADYVGNWERANQIIGRFIRKKQEDNESHIAWFMDNQHLSLYRGCVRVMNRLKDIRGYTFYWRCLGPETVQQAKVYEKLD
jgi:superfamily II DNA or RNA helicase